MAATLFGLTIFLIFAGFIAFVLQYILKVYREVNAVHARVAPSCAEDDDEEVVIFGNSDSGPNRYASYDGRNKDRSGFVFNTNGNYMGKNGLDSSGNTFGN